MQRFWLETYQLVRQFASQPTSQTHLGDLTRVILTMLINFIYLYNIFSITYILVYVYSSSIEIEILSFVMS